MLLSWYNATSSTYYVWKTHIPISDINDSIDWDEVVGLTTNEMLAFQLLKDQEFINPSKPSIRQAFSSIFPSNQQPNTNAALVSLAKRLATEAESVLATGTGTEGSPSTLSFEGNLSLSDMQAIVALIS